MNDEIHQILEQITVLEDELHAAIAQQEGMLRYKIEGERIVFDKAIREAHQRVKLGVFQWFLTVRSLNYFTMPIIYGMAIPLVLFDLCQRLPDDLLSDLWLRQGEGRRLHRV